jgi:hypothetical protein
MADVKVRCAWPARHAAQDAENAHTQWEKSDHPMRESFCCKQAWYITCACMLVSSMRERCKHSGILLARPAQLNITVYASVTTAQGRLHPLVGLR